MVEADILSSIEIKAEAALQHPPDSWFGNDNLWYSHGMSGWNRHRDSDIRDRSNFDVVLGILTEKYGEADPDGLWWVNHASHWAVGWVDQIMVRILIDPESDDKFDEDNITPIFKECMELLEEVTLNYSVLDDMHYSDLEYEETLKNIRYECGCDEEEAHAIFSWLFENDIYAEEEWFPLDVIKQAIFYLGLWDEEDVEGWLEMVKSEGIEVQIKSWKLALDNIDNERLFD
jgi:hypothetical protein